MEQVLKARLDQLVLRVLQGQPLWAQLVRPDLPGQPGPQDLPVPLVQPAPQGQRALQVQLGRPDPPVQRDRPAPKGQPALEVVPVLQGQPAR